MNYEMLHKDASHKVIHQLYYHTQGFSKDRAYKPNFYCLEKTYQNSTLLKQSGLNIHRGLKLNLHDIALLIRGELSFKSYIETRPHKYTF